MNFRTRTLVTLFVLSVFLPPSWSQGNVDLSRYPSLSPDGTTIVFSWRGDLWSVPTAGGQATRLTVHPGIDTVSVWNDDGTRIAFESTRGGSRNLFVMNPDGTDVHQVTRMNASLSLTDFVTMENDEDALLFHARLEGDVYRHGRPYRVSVSGGEPVRLHDAFGEFPALSTSGDHLAFVRGNASWWRRHYRGSNSQNLWLFDPQDKTFNALTERRGNDGLPHWANGWVYFLSDREDDAVNLYRMNPDAPGSIERLTEFDDQDVYHFDVSSDGETIVFSSWGKLYVIRGGASPQRIAITANEDMGDAVELMNVSDDISEAALSPDGQVMAFVAFGEVFIRNIDEHSPTRAVTESIARERHIAWSPDGLRLYFTSDRGGTEGIWYATVSRSRSELTEALKPDEPEEAVTDEDIADATEEEEPLPPELDPSRWHDALQFSIAKLIDTDAIETQPLPSPDGRHVAYMSEIADLMVFDLEANETRTLIEGWDFGLEARWSPDGQWIAYAQDDLNFNSDIYIVPVDGSTKPANITRHPDNESMPRWSADGKILAFTSERVDEEFDVWMVYLDKSLESLTPGELEAYYEDARNAAGDRKPLPTRVDEDEEETEAPSLADSWSLDDAWLRLQRVTSFPGSEWNLELSPGGDHFFFRANGPEGNGIYVREFQGSAGSEDAELVTRDGSIQHLSLDGSKMSVVSGGRAALVNAEAGGSSEAVELDATLTIDHAVQNEQKFMEMARTMGIRFYHNTMKGLDWDALSEQYRSLVQASRTADEFNFVSYRLLGELNGSHLGVYDSDDVQRTIQSIGELGITHTRLSDGFEVRSIVPMSPADDETMGLQVGDVITAIEFDAFADHETLANKLEGRVGEETVVTVRRNANGESVSLDLLLTPISSGQLRGLQYDAWRMEKARLVDGMSDSRLGYIHIQGMNQQSLDVFERDLYAVAEGKEGLIIDVRNNGGGWTTDRLLSSIMVQPHSYTVPRGYLGDDKSGYPQDRLFIQRYSLPINMLCNENSYSNAEIISHAFKNLGRGTLVGQETFGAVISTGSFSLIDGTRVRMPFRGWYTLPDDVDMETVGAIPDIIVPQTPESEVGGSDDQLKAAVDDLLSRL